MFRMYCAPGPLLLLPLLPLLLLLLLLPALLLLPLPPRLPARSFTSFIFSDV
jgi:hypothetical protein